MWVKKKEEEKVLVLSRGMICSSASLLVSNVFKGKRRRLRKGRGGIIRFGLGLKLEEEEAVVLVAGMSKIMFTSLSVCYSESS